VLNGVRLDVRSVGLGWSKKGVYRRAQRCLRATTAETEPLRCDVNPVRESSGTGHSAMCAA
jgi:hypothetical protein